MAHSYLLSEDDGLAMRESNDYAKDKLRILEAYISVFETSMRGKWATRYYVDLQAGPGKNRFKDQTVKLGSPLVSLTTKYPFTHYRFVELNPEYVDALSTRIAISPINRQADIKVLQGDCNLRVNEIVDDISKHPKSLNLAFLDPEGLELQWETVAKLGKMARRDLILNFSTSGIIRNANQMRFQQEPTQLGLFFGGIEWREVYAKVAHRGAVYRRRVMIDYYKNQLVSLGYKVNPFDTDELPFVNKRRAQIYSLIFASKHDLGNEFWKKMLKSIRPPSLL